MKILLSILCSVALMLTGVGAATAAETDYPPAPLVVTDPALTDPGFEEPDMGVIYRTRAHNLRTSDQTVSVASERGGSGSKWSLDPGESTGRGTDVNSVFSRDWRRNPNLASCRTYINNRWHGYGWIDTAWWVDIHIDVRC